MDQQTRQKSTPIFQQIKDYLLAEIAAGRWKEGDVIPSEQALTKLFSVSRMTVNRALRELSDDQILTRRQGSGTYVAPQKYRATLVEIKSIAQEVRARGHVHHSELHRLEQVEATDALAGQFGIAEGSPLFHSVIVHFENDLPIQVEDRWVNPELAPDYLQQDFSQITPNEYLMAVVSLQRATYCIEARLAPAAISDMLAIDAREPCLVLKRKIISQGKVTSTSTMWHPGQSYQYAGSLDWDDQATSRKT